MNYSSKKGFIVPIIIAVVAFIAIGLYAYQNHKKMAVTPKAMSSSAPTTSTTDTTPAASASTNEGTFASLMALSEPQKCEVSFDGGASTKIEGTVYISKGSMRGDYSAGVSGQSFKVHFITDGKDSYTWMDGIAMGFKSALNQTSTDTSVQTKAPAQGFNANQKVTYSCAAWTTDSSLFTLPTDINFTSTTKASASPKSGNNY